MVMWPLLLRPEPRFLLSRSGSKGRPLCRSGLTTFTSPRRPGEVGLTLTRGMALGLLREVDFLARLEAHVRLLPVAASALVGAEALLLAVHVDDLHAFHLDLLFLPQQFHRRLDVLLGGVGANPENDLVVPIGDLGGLLRDDRRQKNGHQALLVAFRGRSLGCRFLRVHPRISSKAVTAAFVSSTFSNRTRLTGSTSLASSTSTCCRLRADRRTLASSLSVTTRTVPERPSALIFCANSFDFGASSASCSTTESLPSRTSCDRIEAIPARYILRLTLCAKFSSGELGKILPPPRHNGLFACPARARPVPFCAHGFLCDLLISPRDFCARVPRRALAWNAVTTWWMSDSLYSRPNSASDASRVAAGV